MPERVVDRNATLPLAGNVGDKAVAPASASRSRLSPAHFAGHAKQPRLQRRGTRQIEKLLRLTQVLIALHDGPGSGSYRLPVN